MIMRLIPSLYDRWTNFPYFASIDRFLRIEVFLSIHTCKSQLLLCDSFADDFDNKHRIGVFA